MPAVETEGNLDKAYQWAIQTCNAPNVGYSQAYRNQQTVNGITYYDCSSFVWFALKAGGFDVVTAHDGSEWPMTTFDEETFLTNLGFTKLDNIFSQDWLPGDIVIRTEHTEMVYKTGSQPGFAYTMGAISGKVALSDQVRIRDEESNRWTQVWRYGEGGATGYGLSIYQCAAILGSFWNESKVNPGEYHNNQTDPQSPYNDLGVGLGMWTDLPADTKTTLWIADEFFKWMEDHDYDWYDGDGQVECLLADELNISGTYNNRQPGSMWTQFSASEFPEYAYLNQKYPTMQDFIDDSDNTDLEELTRAWFLMWESPGTRYVYNLSWNQRWASAQDIYNFLLEHANDSTFTEWYIEEGYVIITNEQAYNNCVMFYKRASAGGGGGGSKTDKKGMPLWMKLRYF